MEWSVKRKEIKRIVGLYLIMGLLFIIAFITIFLANEEGCGKAQEMVGIRTKSRHGK